MTRLWIVSLALVCLLAGWLLGSNADSSGTNSTGRWIVAAEGRLLLNTRTGDTWVANSGRWEYWPRSPIKPYTSE